MPKIYKALVTIEGRGGTISSIDVIEHENMLWLVPSWLDNLEEGWTAPARIICLSLLPHQKAQFGEADFLVNGLLPISVFEGQIPPELEKQYVVRQLPDIQFPLEKKDD